MDKILLKNEMIRLYGSSVLRLLQDGGVDIEDSTPLGLVMRAGRGVLINFETIFKKKLADNAALYQPTHPQFRLIPAAALGEFVRVCNSIRTNLNDIEAVPLAAAEAELKVIHAPSAENDSSTTLQWLAFVSWLERKEREFGRVKLQMIWRAAITKGSEIAYIAARKMEDTMFQELCGDNTIKKGEPADFRQVLIALWEKNKKDPQKNEAYRLLVAAIAATRKKVDQLEGEARGLVAASTGVPEEKKAPTYFDNQGHKI